MNGDNTNDPIARHKRENPEFWLEAMQDERFRQYPEFYWGERLVATLGQISGADISIAEMGRYGVLDKKSFRVDCEIEGLGELSDHIVNLYRVTEYAQGRPLPEREEARQKLQEDGWLRLQLSKLELNPTEIPGMIERLEKLPRTSLKIKP